MILGIGLDLVHLPSFEAQCRDEASDFIPKTFTAGERLKPAVASLAARFAAKEAFIKAWSNALFGKPPVLSTIDMREIEVCHDLWDRTVIQVHGKVAQAFEALGPTTIHLSITHDGPTAGAMVTLCGLDPRTP